MRLNKLTSILTAILLCSAFGTILGGNYTAFAENSTQTITSEDIENSAVKPVVSLPVIEMTLSEARKNPEVTVSLAVSNADFKYSTVEFWTSFDSRLEIVGKEQGVCPAVRGNAAEYLMTKISYSQYYDHSDNEIKDLNGIRFIGASDSNYGRDGNLFSVTVRLPDNVKAGDVYPLEIAKVTRENANNDFVNTVFKNSLNDQNGLVMQEWLLENGLKNGYIKIGGGVQSVPGDANLDGSVTMADAVAILQYLSNTTKYPLSESGLINADVFNKGDGVTGADSLSIQKFDAGVITSLPETIME